MSNQLKAFAQKLFNTPRSIRLQQRGIGTYTSTSTMLKCTWAPKTGQTKELSTLAHMSYIHICHGVSRSPAGILKLNLLISMRDSIHWVSTIKQIDWKLRQTDYQCLFELSLIHFSLGSHKMPKHTMSNNWDPDLLEERFSLGPQLVFFLDTGTQSRKITLELIKKIKRFHLMWLKLFFCTVDKNKICFRKNLKWDVLPH